MARVTAAQFAADLLTSAAVVSVEASRVVKRAAQNVKSEARANVQQSAPTHNAGAYKAINYDDPSIVGARISSEVGYDKEMPEGRLGNLLEYGGGGDHSPPHMDLNRAADAEESRFEQAVGLMVGRLL